MNYNRCNMIEISIHAMCIWMFPKIVFNRVFHYFHHPFCGTTIFGNTYMEVCSCFFYCFFGWFPQEIRHKNTHIDSQGPSPSRAEVHLPVELGSLNGYGGDWWCILYQIYMGVSKKRGYPHNGWWKQWKTLLKWMIWGQNLLFSETPFWASWKKGPWFQEISNSTHWTDPLTPEYLIARSQLT